MVASNNTPVFCCICVNLTYSLGYILGVKLHPVTVWVWFGLSKSTCSRLMPAHPVDGNGGIMFSGCLSICVCTCALWWSHSCCRLLVDIALIGILYFWIVKCVRCKFIKIRLHSYGDY